MCPKLVYRCPNRSKIPPDGDFLQNNTLKKICNILNEKETPMQVFSCEYFEVFKNSYVNTSGGLCIFLKNLITAISQMCGHSGKVGPSAIRWGPKPRTLRWDPYMGLGGILRWDPGVGL